MTKELALKLQAAKKIGQETGVKAIAKDTAGNLLVHYKDNKIVAYKKQMVEGNEDVFISKLINREDLSEWEFYADEDGQIEVIGIVQE